jgi:hypothetical protein
MKSPRTLLAMLLLTATATAPVALAQGVFTSDAAFQAALAGVPSYLNDFNSAFWTPGGGQAGRATPVPQPDSGTVNGFAYTINNGPVNAGVEAVVDPGDPANGYVSTLGTDDYLQIIPTGGPINAIGGNFFLSHLTTGAKLAGSIDIGFNGANRATYDITTPGVTFLGFIYNNPINSFEIYNASGVLTAAAAMDNLRVALKNVPEPNAALLLALGGATMLCRRGRRH